MITASIFLISSMAMRTQNLQADTRARLLVTAPDVGGDALGAARITLVGNVQAIPQPAVPEARNLYLTRHANSMIGLILKIFLFTGWVWWTFTTWAAAE